MLGWLVAATAAMALPPAGLHAAVGQEGSTPDTVNAGVLEYWPPHYLAAPGARPTGFGVDVMDAVAAHAALSVRYVVFPTFPDAIAALADGRVDVIPDFGAAPFRSGDFEFTRSFQTFQVSVVVRSAEQGIDAIEDLAGRRIGIVRSNLAAEIIPQRHPELVPVEFATPEEALFELLAGGVAAIAYPDEVLFALARQAGVDKRIRALPAALAEVPRAMGVRRGDTRLLNRLDDGIERLVGSPEYAEIYRRWLAPPRPFWTVRLVLYAAAGLLLVTMVVMGGWRYRTVSKLARTLATTLADRDRAESARLQQEARFRTLVESSYDGIVTADEDERITFVNRRVCEMVGRSEEELLGRSVVDFIVPEHVVRVREGIARRRKGVADSYEVALQAASGARVWVQISVSPLPADASGGRGSMAVLTDITDRVEADEGLREREERFRAFVEHASDLISTLDREGRMMYQSPPLQRLLGYAPEELSGRTAFELIHPDDIPAMQAVWEEVLASPDKPISPDLFRFRHADGSWRTWQVTLTNLLDNPAVNAVLSNGTDVTGREELTAQLAQAQKMEAVGRLAGGVVHDFNNILTVVRSHADLLAMDPTPEAGMEAAREIGRSVDRAHALTSQLLAFSRHRAIHLEPLDPGPVVRGLEDTLRRLMGERIEYRLSVEEPTWWIRSDANQLEQVLMNLAVNSRDALPEGGVIEVTVRNVTRDRPRMGSFGEIPSGDYVVIELRDDGVGMSPDTLTHIFEPFFTTKEPGKGTGLGLATVYGIVQRGSGYLDVSSVEGQGSTFRLFFPRTESEPSSKEPPGAAMDPGERETSGRTILLVEDDEAVRTAVRRILSSRGYQIVEADSGTAALTVAEGLEGIDLLLTDVVMPGLTGPNLAVRLRERWPDLRAIFMSGYSEEQVQAANAGTGLLINKPFTMDQLLAVVGRAMAPPSPTG